MCLTTPRTKPTRPVVGTAFILPFTLGEFPFISQMLTDLLFTSLAHEVIRSFFSGKCGVPGDGPALRALPEAMNAMTAQQFFQAGKRVPIL